MFEALAERYYTEEEVSEDLRVRLRACWQRGGICHQARKDGVHSRQRLVS